MKQKIKNYIAVKIFLIAFTIMPTCHLKTRLAIFIKLTYGGSK